MDAEGLTLQTSAGEERLRRPSHPSCGRRESSHPHSAACWLPNTPARRSIGQGRVIVAPDLTVPGHPEIFVIGDLAYFEQDGKPLPGVAPVAMQQGRYVAGLIRAQAEGRAIPAFRYRNKGSLAVIGRAAGVADFGRVHFHGWPAWLLWLFVHLMYLAQFRNRVLVFIRWGFQYLSFDRGARLITGD